VQVQNAIVDLGGIVVVLATHSVRGDPSDQLAEARRHKCPKTRWSESRCAFGLVQQLHNIPVEPDPMDGSAAD
jgi:hypothetical protein